MLLRCCSMLLCALTLSACVAPYRAARVDSGVKAIEDYNNIQADAQNRLLLINILRASERRPRHFTGIGAGSISQQLGLNLGPAALTRLKSVTDGKLTNGKNRGLSIGGSITTTPRIDIGALDSKGFVTGLLTPIDNKTILHFANQGWAMEFLALMIIRELEIEGQVLLNTPGEETFAAFQRVVRQLVAANLRFKTSVPTQPPKESLGPPIRAQDAASLEFRAMAAQAGLTVWQDPESSEVYAYKAPARQYYWTFDPCALPGARKSDSSSEAQNLSIFGTSVDKNILKVDVLLQGMLTNLAHDSLEEINVSGSFTDHPEISELRKSLESGSAENVCDTLESFEMGKATETDKTTLAQIEALREKRLTGIRISIGTTTASTKISATIRSPESMIYYLGQLHRQQQHKNEQKQAITYRHAGKSLTLFELHLGDSVSQSDFEYGGKRYHVSSDENDRTLATLGFLQLVIGLQKDAADLPVSSAVNVIGGR